MVFRSISGLITQRLRVAPNIYYLGFAGVVQVGGLRIAGLSGIYSDRHYHLGKSATVRIDVHEVRAL